MDGFDLLLDAASRMGGNSALSKSDRQDTPPPNKTERKEGEAIKKARSPIGNQVNSTERRVFDGSRSGYTPDGKKPKKDKRFETAKSAGDIMKTKKYERGEEPSRPGVSESQYSLPMAMDEEPLLDLRELCLKEKQRQKLAKKMTSRKGPGYAPG